MFLRQSLFRFFLLLVVFASPVFKAFAQPTLPDLANVSQNGINILTWACQYEGVKSIAVQRSSDSNFNYITIGYVLDVKKGIQYYLDGHPKPGPNWYRVKLVFGSDLSWTSNRIKVMVDSASMAKARVLPSNDSLQIMAAKMRTKSIQISETNTNQVKDTTRLQVKDTNSQTVKVQDTSTSKVANANNIKVADTKAVKVMDTTKAKLADTNTVKLADKNVMVTSTVKSTKDSSKQRKGIILTIEVPDIENVNAYSYIKSEYIYTNPFTGHVNIEIADAKTAKYNLEFYDNKNVKILEVPKISEPNIVLDKRNFQRVGMYKFELYKDKVKLETGYITIY
jgi:hypothetical protein